MIKCNLAVILAERGIKITKLSEETGLSRTTLTQLTQNVGKGIQFDTLNKLCHYLDVTPGELLSYLTVDVYFDDEFLTESKDGDIAVVSKCRFIINGEESKGYVLTEVVNYDPEDTEVDHYVCRIIINLKFLNKIRKLPDHIIANYFLSGICDMLLNDEKYENIQLIPEIVIYEGEELFKKYFENND